MSLPQLLYTLELDVLHFEGGRLRHFFHEWRELTSDPEILEIISGLRIDLECDRNDLYLKSKLQASLNKKEVEIIDSEIEKLLGKGVISPCQFAPNEVLSPVFTRPKKDGSHRMILNLSRLNEDVRYEHFKMDTLHSALDLVIKDCWFASIDLKDAYYCVPISDDYTQILRFMWKGQRYEFKALPNGLSCGPRKFTKLLKPVFSVLRKHGHVSTAFLDDSLLLGITQEDCINNILDTLKILKRLGFIVHPSKSVLAPTKQIQYLGVIINSESMKVKLTEERCFSLLSSCKALLSRAQPTIRQTAQAIGKIVASFPAVKYGPLHYRSLEEDKKEALKANNGNYDAYMTLSPDSVAELEWWLANATSAYKDIFTEDPEVVITTDASLIGWGCICDGVTSGGQWLPIERQFHINYLELKAAFFALKCFQQKSENKHVRIMSDNMTTVSCINHMGTSHSASCNSLTLQVWDWCIEQNIWISAAHIAGIDNTAADMESR